MQASPFTSQTALVQLLIVEVKPRKGRLHVHSVRKEIKEEGMKSSASAAKAAEDPTLYSNGEKLNYAAYLNNVSMTPLRF